MNGVGKYIFPLVVLSFLPVQFSLFIQVLLQLKYIPSVALSATSRRTYTRFSRCYFLCVYLAIFLEITSSLFCRHHSHICFIISDLFSLRSTCVILLSFRSSSHPSSHIFLLAWLTYTFNLHRLTHTLLNFSPLSSRPSCILFCSCHIFRLLSSILSITTLAASHILPSTWFPQGLKSSHCYSPHVLYGSTNSIRRRLL